jgi:hypothetical protein
MLRSRLSRLVPAAAVAVLVSACAGADGTERGAIRENVIEPGITAIAQASEFACNSDAATLRTALETYELLVGAPAPDESVLVGEFLREESDLWDVVDGQLVPADPGCGSVPTDAPDAAEIVTSTEPPQSADEMFSGFTTDQIAAAGGEACARQLAAIFSGVDRYAFEVGSNPVDLQQLVDEGYLDVMPELWEITDDLLTPVADSGCLSLN